jgi:hypothetical protein
MKRIYGVILTAMVGLVLLYISRFWALELWPRSGLFGFKEIGPNGGLLARWLRGTGLGPYELLIWAMLVFGSLTCLQRIYDRLTRK